uniref:CCHC-type domain-containing protein n=1 Tax=Glossina pallidipes TaxID=7398 RepID=A0A1B0ACR0_GLOPL
MKLIFSQQICVAFFLFVLSPALKGHLRSIAVIQYGADPAFCPITPPITPTTVAEYTTFAKTPKQRLPVTISDTTMRNQTIPEAMPTENTIRENIREPNGEMQHGARERCREQKINLAWKLSTKLSETQVNIATACRRCAHEGHNQYNCPNE